MSRSLKKGPYIDQRLIEKITRHKQAGGKGSVKTWSRACTVTPEMVGITLSIHNGRDFVDVYITESMVGHKLGEFAHTRRFNGHSKKGKIAKATGSTGRVETE
jgi:small subunit ribosomal protein S19